MTKRLTLALAALTLALAGRAQYQFPNSDFNEDFVDSYIQSSYTYTEPLGWHGYATIDASTLNSMGRSGDMLCQSEDVRTGSTGKSVYVKSTSVFGVVANGVMTNGQIYTHSTTASDGSKNYNFSDSTNIGSENTYGENNKFYTPFTGRPDSMRVWLRFVPAAQGTGNARVSVYLHKEGTVMYDPTDNVEDWGIVVAHAEKAIPANDEWVQYSIPFSYMSDETPGLILATFSTNETPGGGSKDDYLYIDDIEMVYVGELSVAKYAGEDIEFDAEGKASIDALYNPRLMKYETGVGATVETEGPSEDNGYTMTITVTGGNISVDSSNTHTYAITFKGVLETFESDYVEEVPALEGSTLTQGRYYLYNKVVEAYLSTSDNLTDEPEHYWTLDWTTNENSSDSDGTVVSDEETYLLIDRDDYATEETFTPSLYPVTSSHDESSYDTGKSFCFSQDEDGYVEMYRYSLKYGYTTGLFNIKSYHNTNMFAGATSKTELVPYWTGSGTTNSTTSGEENTKWLLVDPALMMARTFSSAAGTASLSEGVSYGLAVFSDRFSSEDEEGNEVEVKQMPAGLYAFDDGEVFHYDGEDADESQAFTLGNEAKTLTYYGILNLVPTVTYDGQTAQNSYDTAYDESLLSVSPLTDNGSQSYTVYYDTDTYELSILVEGYGKTHLSFIQFAAPDLSLNATWEGKPLSDEETLYGVYDEQYLLVDTPQGIEATTAYDEETGTLTLTFTAKSDPNASVTYTVTFVEPDLSLHVSWNETTVEQGTTTLYAAYDEEKLTVTPAEGTDVETSYDEDTGELTITVTAHDDEYDTQTYTLTFVVPDLTLTATWKGETLANGAKLTDAFSADSLEVEVGEGVDITPAYNDTTGVLTITVTAKDDPSLTQTYTYTFAILTTGIAPLQTADTPAPEPVYDLSGRRISGTPRRGIYVIGGRKVLVK